MQSVRTFGIDEGGTVILHGMICSIMIVLSFTDSISKKLEMRRNDSSALIQ